MNKFSAFDKLAYLMGECDNVNITNKTMLKYNAGNVPYTSSQPCLRTSPSCGYNVVPQDRSRRRAGPDPFSDHSIRTSARVVMSKEIGNRMETK